MSVTEQLHCPYDRDDDTIRLYAAEKLGVEQAERFEEHYFGCDRCWNELQQVLEIRAAAAQRARRSARTWAPRSGRTWAPLAAAAAAVILFLGVWQLRDAPQQDVLRGTPRATLEVTVSQGINGTDLRWTPVENAHVYRVEIFSHDGGLIRSTETSVPHFRLAVSEVPRDLAKVVVRVEATDANRSRLGASRLLEVPLK